MASAQPNLRATPAVMWLASRAGTAPDLEDMLSPELAAHCLHSTPPKPTPPSPDLEPRSPSPPLRAQPTDHEGNWSGSEQTSGGPGHRRAFLRRGSASSLGSRTSKGSLGSRWRAGLFSGFQARRGHKRSQAQLTVFVATWNVGNAKPNAQDWSELLAGVDKKQHDLVVIGVQECNFKSKMDKVEREEWKAERKDFKKMVLVMDSVQAIFGSHSPSVHKRPQPSPKNPAPSPELSAHTPAASILSPQTTPALFASPQPSPLPSPQPLSVGVPSSAGPDPLAAPKEGDAPAPQVLPRRQGSFNDQHETEKQRRSGEGQGGGKVAKAPPGAVLGAYASFGVLDDVHKARKGAQAKSEVRSQSFNDLPLLVANGKPVNLDFSRQSKEDRNEDWRVAEEGEGEGEGEGEAQGDEDGDIDFERQRSDASQLNVPQGPVKQRSFQMDSLGVMSSRGDRDSAQPSENSDGEDHPHQGGDGDDQHSEPARKIRFTMAERAHDDQQHKARRVSLRALKRDGSGEDKGDVGLGGGRRGDEEDGEGQRSRGAERKRSEGEVGMIGALGDALQHRKAKRKIISRDPFYSQLQMQLGVQYRKVASVHLMDMGLIVLCRAPLHSHISGVEKVKRATGFGGVVGNKGGLVIKLKVFDQLFCFVSCHLTPHQGERNLKQRNADMFEILRAASLGNRHNMDVSAVFDHTFVLGDLNYRLDLKNRDGQDRHHTAHLQDVAKLVAGRKYRDLLEADQLRREQQANNVLTGFREMEIQFDPTFKVQRHSELAYIASRIPSYCDRILWHSLAPNTVQLSYRSVNAVKSSDHKPVLAEFRVILPDTPQSESLPGRYNLGGAHRSLHVRFTEFEVTGVPNVDSFHKLRLCFQGKVLSKEMLTVKIRTTGNTIALPSLPVLALNVRNRSQLDGKRVSVAVVGRERRTAASAMLCQGLVELEALGDGAGREWVSCVLTRYGQAVGNLQGCMSLVSPAGVYDRKLWEVSAGW